MAPPIAMVAVDAWVMNPTIDDAEKQRFAAVLDGGLQRLRSAGLQAEGHVVVGNAVDEIVGVAKSVRANLIVLGHKHLEGWAERWWRGSSVSQSLIEYAPCSVLIVITH